MGLSNGLVGMVACAGVLGGLCFLEFEGLSWYLEALHAAPISQNQQQGTKSIPCCHFSDHSQEIFSVLNVIRLGPPGSILAVLCTSVHHNPKICLGDKWKSINNC